MTEIDKKLSILYDLLIDNYDKLEVELIELIESPDRIEDTNKFASLLSELKKSSLINPLLLKISSSDKGDPWLLDFLYAVIKLLDESSVHEEFDIPPKLLGKLEIWVLSNKNEIAWKAANLLKFYESEESEKIQLKKLEERGDFFLVYAECILGLLRYNKDKHWELVRQISNDETRGHKLRDFANDVLNNYH